MTWHRSDKPLSESSMMVRLPTHIYIYIYIYASLGLKELSGFANDHRVALVVHRNLYPTRPVSDPHFRLRRWRAALGTLMLTVPIKYTQTASLYRQTSNITRTFVGNKIVDHSGVVRASPVGIFILDLTPGFNERQLQDERRIV